mmetsp:Transcript_97467/g.280513  ORF Transcript_97467/g.280513 Transcript_97467/m.280513 type:complete len:261 (+) Transcript_97467:192-974(+)
MPASMPPRTRNTCNEGIEPTTTQMGPGHMPHVPQPTPNKALPRIKLRSTALLFSGKPRSPPRAARASGWRSMSWKKGSVMSKPPPMTNAKLGSQAPEPRSTKAATLLARAMVLTTSPAPKVLPVTNSSTTFNFSPASCPSFGRAAAAAAVTDKQSAARPAAQAAARPNAGAICSEGAWGGMARDVPRSVAVAMATAMNVGTATQDRVARRARPVSPWPEVQPLAMEVPKPTARPPSAKRAAKSETSCPASPGGGKGSKPP